MHRWFFASEQVICNEEPTPPTSPPKTSRTPSPISVSDTCWKFNVKFNGTLCCNETLAVCGSSPVLGKWNVQQCLPLSKIPDSSYWTLTITLPRKYDVYYRYLICATYGRGRKIAHFWETHFGARLIRYEQEQKLKSDDLDIFGLLDNKCKIERGWLTPDIVVIQFKFYGAPFVLKLPNFKPLLYVKITPLKVKLQEECEPSMECQIREEDKDFTFAYCEVAKLQDHSGKFYYQPKYGTSCGPKEMLIFHLTLADFERTAYLIDLYHYPPKAGADVPPYHFGYQNILPQELKSSSEGTLALSIMCATKHRPIGSMNLTYLMVKAMHSPDFNIKETFQRHWSTKHEGLNVGRKGCGSSFWFQNSILRENTINSFNLAFEHGAEMVEFDIQLTKDLVPILYDDFQLYVSRKLVSNPHQYDVMRLTLDTQESNSLIPFGRKFNSGLIGYPLNKFTLHQLKRAAEIATNNDQETTCNTVYPKYNYPFQTLDKVFKKVNSELGFMIEIKWPQTFDYGTVQESLAIAIDKNEYVDIILDIVLKKAGSRRIIFSSFDADICTMIRLKQNRYPILFSIPTNTDNKIFMDPPDFNTAINFANAMEFLGIIAKCDDIIKMPGKVSDTHKLDLCVFCWGKETRLENTRKYLKALGVDGIIFDRINHVLEPEDLKYNIFVIE